MHNTNQSGNLQQSTNVPPQMNHGGHELYDAHEAISTLVGGLEQAVLYEQHIQDQELKGIHQRHRTFMTQLYNTIIDTFTSGKDPAVPTQTYNMQLNNDVIFGTQQGQPKTPAQTPGDINDQCVSGYMMGNLKACASAFTMTALEATNPVLRRVLADSIPNLVEMAYEIFLYQNKHQYYQVPQLKEQDMQNYLNSFAPIQNTMPH
ncbi:spore coat protein [Lentibacillus saliphilus]|uniref:spore coat protein n=1 Tax=Lentibacillus saliphilus TaxID=2737028 RepID=UPI001C30738E|nr:spore coat protein [Lentibacillus saliphilus]